MDSQFSNDESNNSETFPHALVRASRSVRYAATAALILLAVFLLVETVAGIQGIGNYSNPDADSITVTGEGTATAIPDTATISFGATATAADVATAQTNVTTIINNALVGVKAAGVSSDDITTTSFNVSPHYTTTQSSGIMCPAGMPCPMNTNSVVSGYDVSENVSVKVTDTSKVATILDGLAKANVTNVSGPQFVVGDPDATIAQARGQAIQKAQASAQKLASQLGVHLGKVMSYSDNSSGNNPMPVMNAAMGAMAATSASTPSVPVGQNTYTEDVSVTYEIH